MPRYRVQLDRAQSRLIKKLAKELRLSETTIFNTLVAMHLSNILGDESILDGYENAENVSSGLKELMRKSLSK